MKQSSQKQVNNKEQETMTKKEMKTKND